MLGRRVFFVSVVDIDPENIFYVCREHVLILSEFTGQDVGLMPRLFYCLGACLMLLLHAFVSKASLLDFVIKKTLLSYVIINPTVCHCSFFCASL